MAIEVKTKSGQPFFVEVDVPAPANAPAGADSPASLNQTPITPQTTGPMPAGHGEAAPQRGPFVDTSLDGSLSVERGSKAMGDLEPTMFNKAVAVIQNVAEEVSAGLLSVDPSPSEVELSVNIGFDARGNVWLFRAGTNASLKMVLRWKLPPPQTP